jgi:FKBP-type peptidyl-prolyl cis-trans isomerase
MSIRLCLALALFASLGAVACQKPNTTESTKDSTAGELSTDDEKTIYAVGFVMARNLEPFNLSEAEIKVLEQGLNDGANRRPAKVDLATQAPKISALAKQRAAAVAEEESKASESVLASASSEPGAQTFDSGLVMKEISPGTGDSPKATDTVKVQYEGKLRDGTVFDSSIQRGTPAQFPVNRVIPCWTEGLQKMKVGGKAKLTCPAKMAYGDRGVPGKIKPGAALTFEVELIEIVPPPDLSSGHPPLPGAPQPNAAGGPQGGGSAAAEANAGAAKADAGKPPAPPKKP